MKLFNAQNYIHSWCPERFDYILEFNEKNWYLQSEAKAIQNKTNHKTNQRGKKFVVFVYKPGHWYEYHQIFRGRTMENVWSKKHVWPY